RHAPIGSADIFPVQARIQENLTRVMARTERADVMGAAAREQDIQSSSFIPEAADLAVFRHLRDSARVEHRYMVEPFWSSIPYPMQTMDARYVLRRDAEPAPVLPAVKQ